jgi:hypothetical protein
MNQLLKDPTYRKYFLKTPKFPYDLAYPTPWTVWIHRTSKKDPDKLVWARVRFATFAEAIQYVNPRRSQWKDFAVTSTVIGFEPPKIVRNNYLDYDWCYRCRRPVQMRTFERHHAMNPEIHQYFSEWPVCPFCGASDDPKRFTVVPG